MRKMSLKAKLSVTFLCIGLIPLFIMGAYSYNKSSTALKDEAIKKLVAVQAVKGDAVKRYLEGISNQVLTLSDDVMVQDAMVEFKDGFDRFERENSFSKTDLAIQKASLKKFYSNEFGRKYENENNAKIDTDRLVDGLSGVEVALQHEYIFKNPNPLGSKELLDASTDNSYYSKVHKKYHPSLRNFLNKFGYYDIFLADINSGHIVYSVFKEVDYATSLTSGPYQDTNFADAFRRAKAINTPGEFVLVDYKRYSPSFESPASFIGAPIWRDGVKVGVLLFQMPISRLNDIMAARAGMGDSGETYLFGNDGKMRSDSFLDNENLSVVSSFRNPKTGSLGKEYAQLIEDGKEDIQIRNNYLGQEVISSFSPIQVLGLQWGLVAEISTAEALASSNTLRNATILLFFVSFVLIFLISLYTSKKIVAELSSSISSVAKKLVNSAHQVSSVSDHILASSTQLSEAATEQASSLQETVSSIDEISSMIQKNAEAAEGSAKVSKTSHNVALEGSQKAELMKSSISQIAKGSQDIALEMEQNNRDISKIVNVISEIGEKTKVINDIVFQTKLLSFNASVEAARAGEHGRGFAVVAEEVGNLASMSGRAALEITEMLDSSIKEVTEIVEGTKKKVDRLVAVSKENVEDGTKTAMACGSALDEILKNAGSVNELVKEIASASSEQSTGVREVTKAMQQLDQTTHQNTSVAQESSKMARDLKNHADELNDSISELQAIISGNKDETTKGSSDEGPGKVIGFQRKAMTPQASVPMKKASGMDSIVPDDNDPRFENF